MMSSAFAVMWKLHRYYLKELITSLTLTFVVLFGVALLSTVNRGLERAKGFDLIQALWVAILWAADALPHLMSMSLLFAIVLTFARASQDREITAMRSAGISPRVAMAPALLVGLALSLVGCYAQHYLLPRVHFAKYHSVTEELRNVMLNTGLTDDRLAHGSFVMTWDEQDENRDWLNVYVKIGERHASSRIAAGVYRASRASLVIERDRDVLALQFFDLTKPGTEARLGDPTIRINISAISDQQRRVESDKDLSSDHLLAEVARGQHDNPSVARYTVHRRSCFALIPFLFAPIGFCIGVLSRERGRVLALVFGMVPLALFYISDVTAAKMMRWMDYPLIAWLPALVIFVLGLPFCWRLLRV